MSKSPEEIIGTLPEKNVLERLDTLVNTFDVAFEGWKDIHINVKLLRHVVESYFFDLERMKVFHGIDLADQHKRAAFTMIWITKLHPVQLHTNANMTEALLVINEWFAIHAGLAHLDINVSDISRGYIRNLLYILHYRQPSPEILASAMYLLECSCLAKKP